MNRAYIGAHRREADAGRATTRSTRHRFARRIGASFALLFVLTGCTPWLGMPTVWNGATRTVADAPGSQQTIDAGQVVNWSGCWPGDGCTVHIAAHRSSHGSSFRALPNLAVGAPIELGYDGAVYKYRVTAIEVHLRATDYYRAIHGDLVLQTTHPQAGYVYLVFASRSA